MMYNTITDADRLDLALKAQERQRVHAIKALDEMVDGDLDFAASHQAIARSAFNTGWYWRFGHDFEVETSEF